MDMSSVKPQEGLVSVIIPAFNAERCLQDSVDGALAQTYAPIEVIVVNDGSTDATAAVAARYGERIVYREQANRGQGAARNAGLRISQGEFVAFLDADDYWKPTFVQTCVEYLRAHRDVVAASTGLITRMFDGTETLHPQPFCTSDGAGGEPFVIEDFFDFWARYDHVRTGSNVIRRSIIDLAGLQREDLRIAQDLEYWGYLATFGKWAFIPAPLWIGNSRQVARRSWLAKYEPRRRLCPEVEQWNSRIEPRLRPSEREGYARMRGRVAMIYAHNKILGGARASAYEVVRKYGRAMPACTMSRVLRGAARLGRGGWFLGCQVIYLKEWLKAARLRLGRRHCTVEGA